MEYNRLQLMAMDASVDYDQVEYFFHLVVEECARIAEEQARVYTGEHSEGSGCHAVASAIRNFGTRNRLR